MADVVLQPDQFPLVDFDPARIKAIAEEAADLAGLPADLEVIVEVDDSSPLGRSSIDGMDPVHISLESGALEDPRHPRQLAENGAAGAIGRLLFRAADRLRDDFADAPSDEDLPPMVGVAWEVLRRRSAGPHRPPGPAPALALPLPQPARVQRRGRRRLRRALGRRRPHLGRDRGALGATPAAATPA